MYKEKMLYHLAEVDRLDEKIQDWEQWASDKALEEYGDHLAAIPDEGARRREHKRYIAKVLESQGVYYQRVNQRNSNLQRSIAYGIAALVEVADA